MPFRTNGSTGATGAVGSEPTLNAVARLTETFATAGPLPPEACTRQPCPQDSRRCFSICGVNSVAQWIVKRKGKLETLPSHCHAACFANDSPMRAPPTSSLACVTSMDALSTPVLSAWFHDQRQRFAEGTLDGLSGIQDWDDRWNVPEFRLSERWGHRFVTSIPGGFQSRIDVDHRVLRDAF